MSVNRPFVHFQDRRPFIAVNGIGTGGPLDRPPVPATLPEPDNHDLIEAVSMPPRLLTIVRVLACAFAVLVAGPVAGASAMPATVETGLTPTIVSDKADYAPGETVTLTGNHWPAGERVAIVVNDDAGASWRREVEVVAAADGTLTDTFSLPDHFVATYSVRATGLDTGAVASWSFTDGNLKVRAAGITGTNSFVPIPYETFDQSGCVAPVNKTGTANADATNGDNVAAGSGGSARLIAPASAPASAGGGTFTGWSQPAGQTPALVWTTSADGRTICVTGFDTGSPAIYANYSTANTAPTLTGTSTTVTVTEGTTAVNGGTYADGNGDSVTLTASRGTLTRTGTSSGTWSWSQGTTDGPDDGGQVTITASDGKPTNSTSTFTFTLAVANVAPTVTFTPATPLSAVEGSTHSFAYTVADPGADTATVATSCGAAGEKVAGSDTLTGTTGSFGCRFPDGAATGDVTAAATDSDGATGATATRAVQVANVAPTVALTGATSADEGTTEHYTFTVIDPGADGFSLDAGMPDCDSDTTDHGVYVAGSLALTATGGSFDCTFPDGAATADVTVAVRDSDGAAGAASRAVRVVEIANVAPVVTAPAPQVATEGQGVSFNLGSFADPGADSPWSVRVDWGDGDVDAAFELTAGGTLGTAQHTYADGPASRTVTVEVTDADGASDSASFAVAVKNVAPTVVLSGPAEVNEGSSAQFTYTISDPGDDTVKSVDPDCGDGGLLVAGSASNDDDGGAFSCRFPDGPATPEVSVSATDSDDAQGARDAVDVAVHNVAPSVTLSGENQVDEGSTHTYSFTVTDPGQDGFAPVDGTPDCDADGADGVLVAGSYTQTASGGSFKCTFPDGGAQASVRIKVADDDDATDTASEAVQVVEIANVAPVVTAPANTSADEGATVTFDLGSFTDPGVDADWTVDVDWGDGASASFTKGSPGSLGTRVHTYADGPATHTVKVKVTDADGASGTASFTVSVKNVAPTATITAPGVDEGTAIAVALTGADDASVGDVTAGFEYAFDCGSGYGAFGPDATASCATDDNGTRTVGAKIRDRDGGVSTYQKDVAVANVAPTATLTQDGPVGEGADVHLALTGAADESSKDVTAGFTYSFDCGGGSFGAWGAAASASCPTVDEGHLSVRGRIRDKDGGMSEYAATVQVNNLAPEITRFVGTDSLAGPLAFAPSTFTTEFTDPGRNDKHRAEFTWSGATSLETVSPFTTGKTVDHTFAAGCDRTATVKVLDNAGASDTETTTVDVGTGAWLPPLADQPVSDKLKNGQVLPVKIRVADCTGVPVTGLAPVISLAKGDLTGVNDDATQTISIASVSAADSGTTMRAADGHYVYNLKVNVASADLGKDHTIIIRPYGAASSQTLRHVIVPVK